MNGEDNDTIEAEYRVVASDSRALPFLAEGGKLTDIKNHPVVKSLLRKTPNEIIQYKQGKYAYVPWAYYVKVLTETFGPTWTTEVTSTDEHKTTRGRPPKPCTEVITHVRIITPFGTQPGVGSMIYYPDSPDASYANALKGAISDALRNAASRFGIAADVKATVDETEEGAQRREEQEAWRAALKEKGITERDAASIIGKELEGDSAAFPTFKDALDAVGGDYGRLTEIVKGVK